MSYNLRECKLQNSQFVQYRLEYNNKLIDLIEEKIKNVEDLIGDNYDY